MKKKPTKSPTKSPTKKPTKKKPSILEQIEARYAAAKIQRDKEWKEYLETLGDTEERHVLEALGIQSRMISCSKSGYGERQPANVTVFNGNLVSLKYGRAFKLGLPWFNKPKKIWYGDLDLTLDLPKLQALAAKINKALFVLYEMDGRFENEERPKVEKFVLMVLPTGQFTIGERIKEYVEVVEGKLQYKEDFRRGK